MDLTIGPNAFFWPAETVRGFYAALASTTAARVPFAASSVIRPATVAGGVQMTASSGAPGKSATRAWQGRPSSDACFGLTA